MAVADNAGANRQTGTAVTLSTTWQRITLTTTALTAATWQAIIETNSQQGITFQVDGVQAELQPLATPYVETNGATTSRTAGDVNLSPSGLFDTTQGWGAARFRFGGAAQSTFGRIFQWDTSGTRRLMLSYDSASSRWRYERSDASNVIHISQAPAIGDMVTLVWRWSATSIGLSLNGAAFVSISNTVLTPLTGNVYLGQIAGTTHSNSTFKWFAAGTGTLSDADASTINALGNTDPGINSIPSTASTSAIWTADTSTYTAGSVSRDTSTTYSSSAGSAKVISSLTTGNFTQSVNVGDTNTYTLSAYAYTNGSAVTASDLSLLYNGSTISTTYTSVGNGWYKLTGTLTGANASRNYGVQVASGKVVFVDNMSLSRYALSGTLTSSIFDAENTNEGNNWGTLTYNATTPTNTSVSVKVRTSNSSTMTGATDFSTCSAITTGTDISSNSCVTDGHRYIQYQLTLSTTDTASSTPTFADISIAFSQRDTTAPVSIELDSPGDNSYTNNERPTFKWKATTDATAGLSKYVLEIDNPSIGSDQPSGDFTIDSIPTSGATDVTSNKYVIHFDGFDDSDATNNYISVYTKETVLGSASNNNEKWSEAENGGKLREGKVSWKVKAIDNAGNETSSSRTLLVDRTSPNVEFTQINSVPFSTSSNNNFSTTDKTPTIFGKITDSLSGADNNGETKQNDSGPKVASGPKSIEVRIERENNFGLYDLQTLATVTLNETYWTTDGVKITDNSQNKASKYSTFSFTPQDNLPLGNYRVTSIGKDNVGNTGGGTIFYLTIGTFNQVATPQQKKVQQQKQNTKQEINITNPITSHTPQQPGLISRIFGGILSFGSHVVTYVGDVAKSGAENVSKTIQKPTQVASNLGSWITYSTLSFPEIVFDSQPTKIYDVQITQVSKTSAVVSWKTNHHTINNKINYGENLSYGHDAFAPNYQKDHSIKIENLKPNTKYVFEVMSQNKNYVYDAHHEFTTPKK